MSRSVWKRLNIGIRCDASVAAPPPGPPSKTNTGSGFGFRRSAGATTIFRSIVRPACAVRFSKTREVPHQASGGTFRNRARMKVIEGALAGTLARSGKQQHSSDQREAHPSHYRMESHAAGAGRPCDRSQRSGHQQSAGGSGVSGLLAHARFRRWRAQEPLRRGIDERRVQRAHRRNAKQRQRPDEIAAKDLDCS